MENHDRETCWAPRNPRLLTRAFSLLCVPASVKSMHLLPATPDYSQASNLSIRANSCSSQQVSLVRGGGGRGQERGHSRTPKRAARHRRCRSRMPTSDVCSVSGPCSLPGNGGGRVAWWL